ncbi:hypothetical protein MOV65_06705, partial [Neorhizobium sp. SHOUNA12B]|nr:hypothetical protein [Neorhizobium sp. SHOUNA12B]
RNGRPSGTPSARWLVIGEATLKGIRAALAAKAGIMGDLELLSPSWMKGQAAAAVALEPNHVDPLAIAQMGMKPFVSARQGINAIQAFRHLLEKGVDPNTIGSIEVFLPPVAAPVVSRPLVAEDRLTTIAHLGLQLGIAAFEPARLMDVDRTRPFNAEVMAFAQRVTITADDTLAGKGWPARVVVSTKGQTREAVWPQTSGEGAQVMLDRKIGSLPATTAQRLQRLQATLADAGAAAVQEARGVLLKFTDASFRRSEAA